MWIYRYIFIFMNCINKEQKWLRWKYYNQEWTESFSLLIHVITKLVSCQMPLTPFGIFLQNHCWLPTKPCFPPRDTPVYWRAMSTESSAGWLGQIRSAGVSVRIGSAKSRPLDEKHQGVLYSLVSQKPQKDYALELLPTCSVKN